MKTKIFATLLCFMPGVLCAAVRDDAARVGVNRLSNVASRMPTLTTYLGGNVSTTVPDGGVSNSGGDVSGSGGADVPDSGEGGTSPAPDNTKNCREAYRACMDDFCLLDESEGYRCACSSNIDKSRELIQEIQKIQAEADRLYTEGVEREELGAKEKLIFGTSEMAQGSGLDFNGWLNLGEDSGIGDALYDMAAEYCKPELDACGGRAEMEEALYHRQVVADCKAFGMYLDEQKINAQANKRTAEAAVRKARLEMLDTTNKYNRGECLLVYRACVADKGGCGTNFENCLDADLLGRRANACENVLDQCMSVRNDVLADWEAESEAILKDAEIYSDRYFRQTCLAQIQVCLEDNCATATNSACLSDVNVAAGICPIIGECEEKIPGIQTVVNDKLGYLRTRFCQNDVDSCLREKCGQNFNAPECVGKKTSEITAMCPKDMFPSCKNEPYYDTIVSAVLLQMDYQLMQGCVNHFSEQLGRVCGADMACLPTDDTVESLMVLPADEAGFADLRATVRDNSATAVDKFFVQFEKDKTVMACKDSQKPAGVATLGDSVFNATKMIAKIGAENRALRALETKIAELSRAQDIAAAEKNCYAMFKVETPSTSDKNYSYIRSVVFEPALRNCHVCRMQQVCETGGESKWTSALKAASGGLSGGAAMGTMVNAGWGTAIGGVIGAVGAGAVGYASGGEKEFCQEIESCEDINM